MEIRTPPRVDDYASLAEWKQARALYFKTLKRREPRQRTVEVPVERVVYVEREVVRTEYVQAEPDDLTIPDFLRYDPVQEFVRSEQEPGESDEDTLARLRIELVNLLALEKDEPLTANEDARKRHLTSNIRLGD